jgi:hypothetical protein
VRHEGVRAGTATCTDQDIWDEARRISARERACGALANGATGDAPQVREPAREMTVADLLRHTSGLVSQSDAVLGDAYTRFGLLTSASAGR